MQNDHSEIEKAMEHFWHEGFANSAMSRIIAETGANRAAIYARYGSKSNWFCAALDHYEKEVVAPALRRIAQARGLDGLQDYFHHQIDRAVLMGLPGPGCFMGNTMTTLTGHGDDVTMRVNLHMAGLKRVFWRCLNEEDQQHDVRIGEDTLNALSDLVLVTAQGLWATSRTAVSDVPLRRTVDALIDLLRQRFA